MTERERGIEREREKEKDRERERKKERERQREKTGKWRKMKEQSRWIEDGGIINRKTDGRFKGKNRNVGLM